MAADDPEKEGGDGVGGGAVPVRFGFAAEGLHVAAEGAEAPWLEHGADVVAEGGEVAASIYLTHSIGDAINPNGGTL